MVLAGEGRGNSSEKEEGKGYEDMHMYNLKPNPYHDAQDSKNLVLSFVLVVLRYRPVYRNGKFGAGGSTTLIVIFGVVQDRLSPQPRSLTSILWFTSDRRYSRFRSSATLQYKGKVSPEEPRRENHRWGGVVYYVCVKGWGKESSYPQNKNPE